jgi:ParB/RepB/Spo0J family partition protein
MPDKPAELLMIPLESIDFEGNVRSELGDLETLAASIADHGLIEPIRVHRAGERFVVDVGHRRLAAMGLAGQTHITAIVTAECVEGPARSILQLVENIQRRDLGPLEEAEAFRAILEADPTLTQKALAARIGRSQATVANALRLLGLAPEVRDVVTSGELSGSHAKALAALPVADQVEFAARSIKEGWASHQLENAVGLQVKRIEDKGRTAKRTEKAIAKALERLVADGVSMTEPLILSCSYELDTDAVKTALRTAGFTLSGAWRTEPRSKTACDCTTLRLEVNGNAGVGVVEVCANSMHLDALYAARQSENSAKHAAEEVMLDELEARALGVWKASPPHPIIARLILRYVENYAGKTWTEYMTLDVDAILASLLSRAIGSAHGAKPLPVKSVLAALSPVTEQSLAAERVAAKRAVRRKHADPGATDVAALEALGVSHKVQLAVARGEAEEDEAVEA